MFSSIVVGTDGSRDGRQRRCAQAVELAAAVGARCEIVSRLRARARRAAARGGRSRCPADLQWMVNPREDVDATLAEAARGRARRRRRPSRSTRARATRPTRSSTSPRSSGADLIVVGNKGMTGAKRFLLGSVPNKVSHHAPCSVLIIRTT